MTNDFKIGGHTIKPGERKRITLQTARLYDFTETGIPVEVVRGKQEGPTLFISATIHGDEINGVEIIKRLLQHRKLKKLHGTLIAVPIVNVFGFNTRSRYLPDRRDLNRSFPGDDQGSLASQLAHTFMKEVVTQSDYGIDLHTGAIHRKNLPQIRGCIDDPETFRLAEAFGVPVIINASVRDGSLRQAAHERKIPTLLYEGGEALRFNETVIKIGIKGILSVMQAIHMFPEGTIKQKPVDPYVVRSSSWIRSPHSGILVVEKKLGQRVIKNELLGVVTDPFGQHIFEVRSKYTGIIIGISMLPLVNEGDAIFHIATFENSVTTQESLESHIDDVTGQTETFVT